MDSLGLPHRPPFVFVRKIVTCTPGLRAECLTTFEPDHPMFAGHFPGDPLVPGVILTEALAQTAGIAAASGYAQEQRPLFLLSAIRQMKFLVPVRPGQELLLAAEKTGQIDNLWQFEVRAMVEGREVASGQLVLNSRAADRAGA